MKLESKLAKFAISLAVLIALAALTVNRVQAFRPTAVEYHLGIVGIAQGQTARLNVLNPGGDTMNLSLNFRSLDGRPVRQRIVTVEGGQGASLDLRFPDADVTGRIAISAYVEISERDSGGGGGAGRLIIPTLEVFDNDTGRTQVVLGACDGSV